MTRGRADEEIHASGPPSPLPHNSCVDHQESLPSTDVSRRLPAEILESIFIHIARRSYKYEEFNHSTPTSGPSWVNVSYVCRYWRDVALNCATLWSYIPLTSQRWTQELLARSQMAPLRISTGFFDECRYYDPHRVLMSGQALSTVKLVMDHSQRIQRLFSYVNTGHSFGYQIVSKFFFTCLPCLQHLEMSYFYLPDDKPCFFFNENTPALHTLILTHYRIPWYALGPSVLTTLDLASSSGLCERTMVEFLAMLCRMPHLVQLSVNDCLPSARDFLTNGEFDATPMISLPHLSTMSIMRTPLSAVIALLSCLDFPLRTRLELENTFEHTFARDDYYVRLASLLGQRINQPNSPKFRSLAIGSPRYPGLAFSTSERVECDSDASSSFSTCSDDNTLLKINFISQLVPVFSGICSGNLTNIQSVRYLGSLACGTVPCEFWSNMLTSLPNVRHIRISEVPMPNITSILSLPSHHLSRSWENGRADQGQDEISVPALEELELYKTRLRRGATDVNQWIAVVQDLCDAIATRKETRCRFTIKEGRLLTDEGLKDLELVGWWEGDQFRVTSNV